MTSSKKFFTEEKRRAVIEAISEAEKNTSGEIRLFIEDNCKEDVLDRAAFIFKQLKMHETALRNGVLFYLAMNSHKFAILEIPEFMKKFSKIFGTTSNRRCNNILLKMILLSASALELKRRGKP